MLREFVAPLLKMTDTQLYRKSIIKRSKTSAVWVQHNDVTQSGVIKNMPQNNLKLNAPPTKSVATCWDTSTS